MTVQTTIGHQIHVAAQHHHDDAVGLVFLNDVVTDFLCVVDAGHAGVDFGGGGDAVAETDGVVIRAILVVAAHETLVGDDQHIVGVHLAAFGLVGCHHLRVLGQTTDAVLDLGGGPKHVAVVVLGSFQMDAHCGFLGVGHTAVGRDVTYGREGRKRKGVAVFVLGGHHAMVLNRIHGFRGVELLVFHEGTGCEVVGRPRRLIGEEVEVRLNKLEVGQFHFDRFGLLTWRKQQTDALPGQGRLTGEGRLHAAAHLDLLVTFKFGDGGSVETVVHLDGLGVRQDASDQ